VAPVSDWSTRRDPRLEGAWLPVAAYVSGEVLPVTELRIARLMIKDSHYQILDHQQRVVDGGEVRLDTAASPCTMDIVGLEGPNAGRTLRAIYELSNDLLSICYDMEDGAERPRAMQPEEDQILLLITYARDARVLC
jgi:uncharacterized protein (TIGR03067 family)